MTGAGALARSGRRAAAALLVAVAACLALPLQAVTLVNNLSESTTSTPSVGGSSNVRQAQKFTVPTGQDYSLDDVTIGVGFRGADGIVVSIRDGSAADPPGTALYTLIDPASPGTGNQTYSAPAGAVLEGGNNYFVMLERAQNSGGSSTVRGTDDDGQSGETDWLIDDVRRKRSSGTWSDDTHALKIRIRGDVYTPSTDATLSDLELEGATGGETIGLSPAFDSATETYTASVANRIDAVTLTATKNDTTATVAITNDDDTNTQRKADLDLNVGSNTLTVTVTPESGAAKTYTITVTRAAAPPAPTDCPADTDWCTTLGVGYAPESTASFKIENWGYQSDRSYGDLLSTTFSHGGTSYTVSRVSRTKITQLPGNTVTADNMNITINQALLDGTVLQLGSRTFTVDTDSATNTIGQEQWDIRGNPLSWTAGQHVTASLKFPTAPDQPTGLTATANGATQIDLAWVGPADNGGATISGYRIEVSADAGTTWTDLLANTGTTSVTYSHTGLTRGSTRHYRVSAINANGTGAASDPTSATTATPTPPAPPEITVPNDWSLIPTGLSTGDKFRLIFLSSTKTNSGSADIVDYNSFIQGRAAAGHTDIQTYSAGFRAVGCTADSDARDNTATTGTGVVIYWLNGNKVADDYTDFYDGSWDEERNNQDRNELGNNGPDTSNINNYPYTGCKHDGTESITGTTSYALGAPGGFVRTGRPNSTASGDGPLSSGDTAGNTFTRPMYGLSQVFEGAANAAPTFTDGTSTTREFLDESIGNATADTVTRTDIGQPVAATDTDTGDTLEYTLSGTDAAKFTIDTTSGQIRDKGGENYDYEAKASYAVTVTVMDGNGGSDTIAVTLNLLDQDEPPLQPVAPNMTEHNDITKFNIRLTPPDNTGRPNISEYRARFHAPGFVWTMSSWTTSLNRVAGGVISGVRYTVQYRARNDEGEGPWSPSGFFSTIAHATGAPDITGTDRVGQTLTAGTSGISDGNGKSKAENGDVGFAYTYQWVRRVSGTDTNITGETASTYTLTAADQGNKVKVKVRFTDNAGYSEGPLTSNAYPSSGSVREACDGVWCATLNVTTLNGNHLGCANSQSGNACSNPSRLTEDEFTHASTSYSVTSVQDRTNGQLQLWINPDITSASLELVLHVGTDTFNFQDADTKGANNRYWNNAGLSWSSGGAVELKLSEAPAATDATLSALALANNNGATIALTPGFVTGTKSYTAMVAMGVSSITLTPAVNESNATVAYLNASDAAITDTDLNTPALDAPLVVGENTFKVKVTAEDTMTTDTYTVVVTRAASNTATTGTPSIDGTPQVGMVLTAAKGTLADFDGTTKADNGDTGYAYSYQWVRVDGGTGSPITGATASTYTLTAADLGKTIKVQTSFTDDGDTAEGPLTSAATVAVLAAAGACPTDNDWCTTLTVGFRQQAPTQHYYGYIEVFDTGALDDVTINYGGSTWSIDALNITDDAGTRTIKVDFAIADGFLPRGSVFTLGGQAFTATATSEDVGARRYEWPAPAAMAWIDGQEVTVSVELANFAATGKPAISGTAAVGETLTAVIGNIADTDGLPATFPGDYTFQWLRVDGGTDSPITGATASTYTPVAADVGKTVKVTVSFTDDGGTGEALTSNAFPSSGTIVLETLPVLSFDSNEVTVDEDAGSATLTVELTPASTGTVTVDYATRDRPGGAREGEDFTATSGTLTFTAGQTSKTVTVPILNDDAYENDESFFVDLSNPTGATLPDPPLAAIGINSEDAVPTASMADVTVDEGAGTMTLILRLSHPSHEDINYFTSDDRVEGTATEGDDYDDFLLEPGRTATITVPAEELSQTFDITIVDDGMDEPDETIIIIWRKSTGDEVTPTTVTFTGTIVPVPLPVLSFASNAVTVDEDAGSATLTVELAPASTGTVTVDYATRGRVGAATAGDDYTTTSGTLTFTAGQTSKTITVPILNDDVYENDESFFVDLSNPSGATLTASVAAVRIDSEDAVPTASLADVTVDEGAGTMTLTLRLSHPSQPDITYLTSVGNVTGTATEGDDYDDFLLGPARTAKITVPAFNLSQTFDITIVDDGVDEPDETIVIGWHKNISDDVTPNTFHFTGTIVPEPLPALSFVPSEVTVDEDAGPATLTVELAPASSGTVTVDYATRDSFAKAGEDYTATSGTLTFTAGQTSKTFTVPITDDDVYENNEAFFVDLSNPTGATLPDPPFAAVRIDSEEAAPTASMADVTVDEGAGTMTLTLRLSHPSDAEIAYLTIYDEDIETGTATAGEDYDDFLLGPPGRTAKIIVPGGSLSQTFDITVVDDGVDEADETIVIEWIRNSNDDATPDFIIFTGTITDNDTAANNPPVFDDGASTSRAFNETRGDAAVITALNIGTAVGAMDDDNDTLAYSLEGADAARFGIITATGQLRTRAGEKYDYEAQPSYAVRIRVVDGRGGADTIDVTVNVNNNSGETPLAPAVPTVTTTPGSMTGLDVFWVAPDNRGRPAITGYDLRYRAGAVGGWTDGPQGEPGTSASITGLTQDTSYQVQVRALNEDGDGDWSTSGSARTGAPPTPTVRFGATSYTAIEGVGGATVTVALSVAAARSVTVRLTKTHLGGATAADYAGVPSSVTFAAGETEKTFIVMAVVDTADDDGESVQLGFDTLPAGVALGSPATATVALVQDADVSTWYVWFGASAYTATEGGTARITVHLNAPWKPELNEALTVPLFDPQHRGGASADDYSGVPESVTFQPGQTQVSFTVQVTDDSDDDDGESVLLAFRRLFPDDLEVGRYGARATTLHIADNDGETAVTVSFDAANYTAVEDGATATVRLLLNAAPGRSVTIPLTKTHRGATAADYSGLPGSVTFGASETEKTLTVTATDDSADDDRESVAIGFGSLPSKVSAGSPSEAVLQLTDNDGGVQVQSVQVRFDARAGTVRDGVEEGGKLPAGHQAEREPGPDTDDFVEVRLPGRRHGGRF